MELDTKARPVALNDIKFALRAAQMIYQYGPGAMVDFPGQTLMTAAPEYWENAVEHIHDERLERALKVNSFGMPSGGKGNGISYARFPEWYFCPKCRRFKPIREWVEEHRKRKERNDKDPDMVNKLSCTDCGKPLVVSRIVVVCEKGHIDDFPWVEWVHAHSAKGKEHVCNRPRLKLKTASSASEGLESISVECESCGAWASLSGAFGKDVFKKLNEKWEGRYDFTCHGRHPWKHASEDCGVFPRTMQRGSSSVYFPVTVSSLVIPPYSSLLTRKVEASSDFEYCQKEISRRERRSALTSEDIQEIIQDYSEGIARETGEETAAVAAVLERKFLRAESEEKVSEFSYRSEEYDALTGTTNVNDRNYDGDFVRESTDIAAYGLPFLRSISLISKVREVTALKGFTRINPLDSDFGAAKDGSADGFVPIKERKTKWYPAYQVRGEGIFIEFDEACIDVWRNSNPDVSRRAALLNENYKRSMIGEKRPRQITEKYLLLHTIAHLLIKQLSFECGYGIASLKERIYCGEADDGKRMEGIFIYTASGDSEGTLGGLVRQGRADVFPRIFRKAIETARICSGDPVCSLSNGQGRDALNLAACYSCALLPETSCEIFNAFLDRGVVVGTMRSPQIGFFAGQLQSNWRQNPDEPRAEPAPAVEKPSGTIIPDLETGADKTGVPWHEIWEELACDASDRERRQIRAFMEDDEALSGRERPRLDCTLQIKLLSGETCMVKAELCWPDSHVAVFMEETDEVYRIAARTDWKCHRLSDTDFTPETLARELKEV